MRLSPSNLTHTLTHIHMLPLPRYLSAKYPTYVNYMQFSDEVESIFTHKNLEKTPMAEVQQFVRPIEVDLNILSPEILQKTMHQLAERVRRASGKRERERRGVAWLLLKLGSLSANKPLPQVNEDKWRTSSVYIFKSSVRASTS